MPFVGRTLGPGLRRMLKRQVNRALWRGLYICRPQRIGVVRAVRVRDAAQPSRRPSTSRMTAVSDGNVGRLEWS